MPALTAKQAAFVAEYLVDKCAAAAARRAGFSEASAEKQGSELLSKPHVRAAVDAALKAQEKRTLLTADVVLEGLLSEAKGADSAAARVSAWGLLGKHLGIFVEKVQHSGADGAALQVIVQTLPKES